MAQARKTTRKRATTPAAPKVQTQIERTILLPCRDHDDDNAAQSWLKNRLKITRTGDGEIKVTREYKYSHSGASNNWNECDETFGIKLADLKEVVDALDSVVS